MCEIEDSLYRQTIACFSLSWSNLFLITRHSVFYQGPAADAVRNDGYFELHNCQMAIQTIIRAMLSVFYAKVEMLCLCRFCLLLLKQISVILLKSCYPFVQKLSCEKFS
jgi:hypothetical protein